jgi:hypothetical protein
MTQQVPKIRESLRATGGASFRVRLLMNPSTITKPELTL